MVALVEPVELVVWLAEGRIEGSASGVVVFRQRTSRAREYCDTANSKYSGSIE